MDTIMIVGEMAVPFLALFNHITAPRYDEECFRYKKICAALVSKARLRGTPIILPVDVVVSEEALPSGIRQQSYDQCDPDARDEGVEFEAEFAPLSLVLPEPVSKGREGEEAGEGEGESKKEESVPTMPTVIDIRGYVYDIGPETCNTLAEETRAADLVLIWGCAGACEITSFQTGQRALVSAVNKLDIPAAPKANAVEGDGEGEEESTPLDLALLRKPAHTVVLGASAVEWFSRIVDPDGELKGDVVAAGAVSYACRRPTLVCGRIAGVPSAVLSEGVARRQPSETEFVYQVKKEVVEEEEDE